MQIGRIDYKLAAVSCWYLQVCDEQKVVPFAHRDADAGTFPIVCINSNDLPRQHGGVPFVDQQVRTTSCKIRVGNHCFLFKTVCKLHDK